MPFTNACFLSYRQRPGKDYQIFLEDLYETLTGELQLLLPKESVFRDSARMQGGDFLEPAIAQNLCQSACMIMVYIPPYFDETAPYCAREFQAMQRLESLRLQLLGTEIKSHSLIIPIICRGWTEFPKFIGDQRLSYNFEPWLLQKSRLSKHKQGHAQLLQIARYVFERFKELQQLANDPCKDCGKFLLPSENEIVAWVRGVQGPRPLLPGRSP